MFDTSPDGIRKIISSGESQYVEFKAKLPTEEIIAKTISAFANTEGGEKVQAKRVEEHCVVYVMTCVNN